MSTADPERHLRIQTRTSYGNGMKWISNTLTTRLFVIDIFNQPLIDSYSDKIYQNIEWESDMNDNRMAPLIWLSHYDTMVIIFIRYTCDPELHTKQTERRVRKWRYTRHYFSIIS